MGYIYLTTNLKNNKKYIGMTTKCNNNYFGSGKLIKRAIKKYGRENFKFDILQYENDFDKLCDLERYYIKKYNAIEDDNFYNIHEGGNGGNTIKGYTEEQKQKYKEKMKIVISELYKDNDELRKRISENVKLSFDKNNSREKISKSIKQRIKDNPEYLKKISDKTKEAFKREQVKNNHKNGNLKAWQNEERRKKYSEMYKGENNPNYGNKISDENKLKMAKARAKVLSIPIAAYDDNGNQIYFFEFKKDAQKFCKLNSHSSLNRAIKSGKKYKGFYWKEVK